MNLGALSKSDWKHDELAADLAQYLRSDRRMVWTDMQLGPSGSPRPDVYTIEKSYSRPQPTAYECKVSRSDLRSDTTSGKWQSYLRYAGAVIFAVPNGLCTLSEIPANCGLIVRKDEVWRLARKPVRQPVTLPMDAFMKLLIDGVSRTTQARSCQPRKADLWNINESVRQKFGDAVALAAADLTRAHEAARALKDGQAGLEERAARAAVEKARHIIHMAEQNAAEFEAVKRELCEWLGVECTTAWQFRRHIAKLRAECSADERVRTFEAALSKARRSMRTASEEIEALFPIEGGTA